MKTLTLDTLKLLDPVFQKNDFIVIGEMHGSKENAPIMEKFMNAIIKSGRSLTVTFEWSLTDSEAKSLERYVTGGPVPEKIPDSFIDSDGRFTEEHCHLLKKIRSFNLQGKSNIKVCTFDGYGNFDDYENYLSNNLILTKHINKDLILVETGSIHARKTIYYENGLEEIPMTSILSKNFKVYFIFLKYLDGEINVEDVNVDVTLLKSQIDGPHNYFDAIIEIPKSHASEPLNDLTEIMDLLK